MDWVRLYLCFELDWDVRLMLKHDEVPPMVLGRDGRLGWTTWLGRRQSTDDPAICAWTQKRDSVFTEPRPYE